MKRSLRSLGQRGFTLLLAALISAIVLSLASALFSIAKKQVTLASLSQQSQYAFYAADTGAECALYWDIRYGYFGTVTPTSAQILATSPAAPPQTPTPPQCDGQSFTLSPPAPYTIGNPAQLTSPTYEYTTSFQLRLHNNYCAQVSVIKCLGDLLDSGVCCHNGTSGGGCTNGAAITTISTQIRSDGFNTSCDSIGTSQTALQRSVELNY